MTYLDCVQAAQAAEDDATAEPSLARRLAAANINPATGLASDYLNHFHEAIMLLEMLSSCPDCRDDFLDWQPMSYREHFAASQLAARDLAIAAYEHADPVARGCLDTLAGMMTALLETTRTAMRDDLSPAVASMLADRAAGQLRTLVARASAVINGETAAARAETPQAMVDALLQG